MTTTIHTRSDIALTVINYKMKSNNFHRTNKDINFVSNGLSYRDSVNILVQREKTILCI